MSLSERLAARIAREGTISFFDFMEAALYDPLEGYYAKGGRIGEGGDFVTSPAVSPLFAAAIARRFRRETEAFEGPVDFVEAAASDGRFLADFAQALGRGDSGFAGRVRLTAIERSAVCRERLSAREDLAGVRVFARAEELPPRSINGWIFSNELYDALPVHRVRKTADGFEELSVAAEGGRFVWTAVAAPEPLRERAARLGAPLEPGQTVELSPLAVPVHRALARALARGSLVAFDYGHRANVLYHAIARRNGTLAAHSGGRRGGDPLASPGDVDLTAHVNWDELARAGEEEGLATAGIARQGRYLTEAGLFDLVGSDAEKWRAYRLIDPEGMGEELSVLIQSRP